VREKERPFRASRIAPGYAALGIDRVYNPISNFIGTRAVSLR